MGRVRMVHPGLPGQEIEVPEAAVFGHSASGWCLAEQAETADAASAPPVAASATTPSAASPTPAATSRRASPPSGQDKE